jgi:hypothetical protein
MILCVILFAGLTFLPPHVSHVSPTSGSAFSLAALCDHVVDVVGRCSKKQMLCVDAWRIVTPMKNDQSVGDRAVCEFVGNAMGEEITTLPRSRSDKSVSVGVGATYPENATGLSCLPNIALESGCKRNDPRSVVAGLRAEPACVEFQDRRKNLESCSANVARSGKFTASHDSSSEGELWLERIDGHNPSVRSLHFTGKGEASL